MEGSGATTAAQIMGTTDKYVIASCSGEATAIAVSKGIPIKSLAVLYPNVPTVLYSREDTPIRTPKDLLGKKVGLTPGSITVDEYRGLLKANGIDRSQIQEVNVGWDPEPLLGKKVDGLVNYEEMTPLELRVQGHRIALFRFADFGLRAYSLNLVTSARTLENQAEVIQRLVRGIVQGYEFVKKDPGEAAQIFGRLFPEKNREYIRESMKIVARLLGDQPVGSQTLAGWNETIKTLGQLGLLEKPVTAVDVTAEQFLRK